jgi:hypothetical protein
MREYDVHVIPWEHNTGTRTRVPVALRYRQVVVACREGVRCFPELKNGYNCILVNNLQEMPDAIRSLLCDTALRRRIADAGHETFVASFTHASVQKQMDRLLSDLGVDTMSHCYATSERS